MIRRVPGWSGRTNVERVGIFVRLSLYVLFWFLLALSALSASALVRDPLGIVLLCLGTVVLAAAGTLMVREALRLHPRRDVVPWVPLTLLVAVTVLAEALLFMLPGRAQFAASIIVLAAFSWGAGGVLDRRVQWLVYVASPVLTYLPTGSIGLAAYGLAMGLFFVFTVQSSLWLLGVVTELDEARAGQARLAVAEERLRFSRDVHDVLGRRLSTIAVQAELAATFVRRGDARATDQILEVREIAHQGLREARELARGYRPLDLRTEVDGAVSLLRSAGIEATADIEDLPEVWHDGVARVIRESVTNVLRHSRATHVQMTYADREVVIRNDGVSGAAVSSAGHDPGDPGGGAGLAGLAEHLEPQGARLTAERVGDEFVVRALLTGAPTAAGEEP